MHEEAQGEAYKLTDEVKMADAICEIMHLLWFERLLDNHFEGVIAHATYKISTSKLEGINNNILTNDRDESWGLLKTVSKHTHISLKMSHLRVIIKS